MTTYFIKVKSIGEKNFGELVSICQIRQGFLPYGTAYKRVEEILFNNNMHQICAYLYKYEVVNVYMTALLEYLLIVIHCHESVSAHKL